MYNNNNGYFFNFVVWIMVVIFMVVYVLFFIDWQIFNLLVGLICCDLVISDMEMSLLMGLFFVLFYIFCGILFGCMVDNCSWCGLILFGVLVWSVMIVVCGLVCSYW